MGCWWLPRKCAPSLQACNRGLESLGHGIMSGMNSRRAVCNLLAGVAGKTSPRCQDSWIAMKLRSCRVGEVFASVAACCVLHVECWMQEQSEVKVGLVGQDGEMLLLVALEVPVCGRRSSHSLAMFQHVQG